VSFSSCILVPSERAAANASLEAPHIFLTRVAIENKWLNAHGP
jgi:hypothetical protein